LIAFVWEPSPALRAALRPRTRLASRAGPLERTPAKLGAVLFITVHKSGVLEQSHSRNTGIKKICDIKVVHFARPRCRAGLPKATGDKSGAISSAKVHPNGSREQSHSRKT
jgi:hypothetical protein